MRMFPDNSADVVTALALLEHLENVAIALKECFRILRPGGLFVATAPVSKWEHIADSLGPKNAFGGDHHQSDVTYSLIESLSKSVGFEFVDYRKFMWAPVAFLPYAGIPVSAKFAWAVDRIIGKIKILNLLFVNQRFVLKKPL
jgi:SAM-dependent methyltransferase